MNSNKKYSDENLYDLLGISIEADNAEIRKAYRKKALECHPDKNPDNPKAAELFHELSRALEILTDAGARDAYDKVLKAKKATELRNRQLDSKRQKLKADLEQRERDAVSKLQTNLPYTTVQKNDEQNLRDQIERLRREGSKLLEEEQRLMREQLKRTMEKESKGTQDVDSSAYRIKIKWNANKKDPTNGGYSEDKIRNYMKKYGDIVACVISKKNGNALLEFKTRQASEMAVNYEKGSLENPLHLSWLNPESVKDVPNSSNTATIYDFEDLVLRKLRQAEERKRIIEQLKKEDEEN